MENLGELLAVSKFQALKFFWSELLELEPEFERKQILYLTSVLAHYSQVSTESAHGLPTPRTLADIFNNFVLDDWILGQPEVLEEVGSQVLLLTGFFRNQMSGRHNVNWYCDIGAGYFARSGKLYAPRKPKRAEMLCGIASQFVPFSNLLNDLAINLRRRNDDRYLIR